MADDSGVPGLPALSPGIAIFAGRGDLPRLIAEDQKRQGHNYRVVTFPTVQAEWAEAHPHIEAEFEKPGRLFNNLRAANCTRVTLAGGMDRPRLNPLKFDFKFLSLSRTLLRALRAGDDETLRVISDTIEAEDFSILAPHELLEDLLAESGVMGQHAPSKDDQADITRAIEISRALGAVDVGQGAIVAQGICLGTESIQGTDAMLKFVAETGAKYRFDNDAGKGVLVKSPKPGQDWRVDLPAIGPDTVQHAAQAGLAGIAVQTGGVLLLSRAETISKADAAGLFLIGFEATSTEDEPAEPA